MKRILAPVIALSLLAGACAGPKTESKTAWQDSASDRLARTIASSNDVKAMEESYQAILQDANPSKRLESYFSRLVRIYYRTNGLVKDYDAKLELMHKNQDQYKASDLVTDKTYARLMAAWIINNRQIDKISYIYERNYIEVMKNKVTPVKSQQEIERDLTVKRSLMAIIKKYGASDRLAMQNLLIHLGEVARVAHENMNSSAENTDAAEFEEKTFSSGEAQAEYIKKQKKKKAQTNFDKDVDAEILTIQQEVQDHLKESFQERTPQSEGTAVPSAGPAGNLTGNTFKAGRWALTFDDGPSAKHTSAVLTNLEARGLKTSFFWLASLTPSYPTLINRAKDLGMALGNHSFSHANLPKQGAASLQKEIVTSTEVHKKAFGFKPTYFRCPYGACGGGGSNIRQMIANQGMVHIFWNIDSLDWQDKNPASIVNRVKKAMAVAKKGIILFHDIHPQSVEATKLLMDSWAADLRSGSMRLLTIPQAIQELNSDAGMQ